MKEILLTVVTLYLSRFPAGDAASTPIGMDDIEDERGVRGDRTLRRYERINTEGVPCDDNESSCASDEYCHRVTGTCDGPGVCRVRPMVCTMDYTPVCGCDGEIYGNLCGAYATGMTVSYVGECGSTNQWYQGWFSLNPAPVKISRDGKSHSGTSGARDSLATTAAVVVCGLIFISLL